MAKVTLAGNSINTKGNLPSVGSAAPDFSLVKTDLSELTLADQKGTRVVLNIFPSLDTSVCATSVRTFNKLAAEMKNTVVLAISKDLPFAHARFCTTEGIDKVIPLSAFRDHKFGEKYGVELPICRAVYDILYEGAAPQEMLNQLLRRSIKNEF